MLQEWLVNINSILYIMYLVKEIYNVNFYKKKRGLLRGIVGIFLMFFFNKEFKEIYRVHRIRRIYRISLHIFI